MHEKSALFECIDIGWVLKRWIIVTLMATAKPDVQCIPIIMLM